MSDLPTPVGGDNPERDVILHHGRRRFDATGLFIQWLGEQISRLAEEGARIDRYSIELRCTPDQATVVLLIHTDGTAVAGSYRRRSGSPSGD